MTRTKRFFITAALVVAAAAATATPALADHHATVSPGTVAPANIHIT
ncbi:hypothetical protein [Streptomyces sp. NPDC050738]